MGSVQVWHRQQPCLRGDLEVYTQGEERFLRDPLLRAMYPLSPETLQVLRFFNGQRRQEEILALAHRWGIAMDAEHLSHLIDDLAEAHLLLRQDFALHLWRRGLGKEAEEEAASGLFYVAPLPTDAAGLAVSCWEGLRFTCMQCGACCRGLFPVVLQLDDLERLNAVASAAGLGLSAAALVRETHRQGRREFEVAQCNGACALLADDGRCTLHLQYSFGHKPHACRAFPFAPVMTPRGALLRFRPECVGSVEAIASEGALVHVGKEALWQDVCASARAVPWIPGSFPLRLNVLCSYAHYDGLQAAWLEAAARSWREGLQVIAAATQTTQARNVMAMPMLIAEVDRAVGTSSPDFFQRVPSCAGRQVRDVLVAFGLLPSFVSGEFEATSDHRAGAAVLEAPELQAVLNAYLCQAISGAFFFEALSVAAGAGLSLLTLFLAEASLCYCHHLAPGCVTPSLTQGALSFWHRVFFGPASPRTRLITAHAEALEEVLGMVREL